MKELRNKTIGVFFGGQNPEHDISIITGEFVRAELEKMGLKAVAVYISRNGAWYSNDKIAKLKFFKGDYGEKLKSAANYCLDLKLSQRKLVLKREGFLSRKKIAIDFIFPALHGLYGEDGTIQGLADFFRVPYAGCGIYASSVSVDKVFTKKLLKSLNMPITNFTVLGKREFINNSNGMIKKIEEAFAFPVFVKPARTGSSIGITKVKDHTGVKDALSLAFHYDAKVIVESSVENIVDLTCAVLGDKNKVMASEVQESVFKSDLFDYNVKYLENGGAQMGNAKSNLVIPANISEECAERIKNYSKRIFNEISASGMLRVDFLLNKKSGELFANEINTLPGTLCHHLWKESGVSIKEILEIMLDSGFARWKGEQEIHNDFKTDVLNNANRLKLRH